VRIALISTLTTPVRRGGSGSVESIVWLLASELNRRGHRVTVFASGGSQVGGEVEVVQTLPGTYGAHGAPHDWQLCEWMNLCRAVEESGRFDVLHSHVYLWGLPLQGLSQAPMVHTLHVCPDEDAACLWAMTSGACVTAISRYQWSAFPDVKPAAVIHHGVDAGQFTFREMAEDYVCYFGRFTRGKGPATAIAAARALGLRLVLAGPRNEYFAKKVEPLVDGRTVEYIGPVGGAARDRLLGGARALLYPLQEPEPFGLVPVEAMMCGTPVAAICRGAVAEILEDGVTGHAAALEQDFAAAVEKALTLDRRRVHERATARFSAGRMAEQYVEVYERVLGEGVSR
jgi:glycosyltransferase involved in cell wall biosynthesis